MNSNKLAGVFGAAGPLASSPKKAACSMSNHLMPKNLMPGTPQPAAPGSSAAGLDDEDAGPPAAGPAGLTGRAARGVRRAVQSVGGRVLAVAAAVMTAYGLWQVFRWGGP